MLSAASLIAFILLAVIAVVGFVVGFAVAMLTPRRAMRTGQG